tara:strand:- start:199 stop:438 length:240 start_codon:yes stop_codon:yes gene_type:complete
MRLFLFKILLRLTCWVAPNRPRVNRLFDIYLEEIKKEEDFKKCQERQSEMDKCVRPRTYPRVKGHPRYTDYFDEDNWSK